MPLLFLVGKEHLAVCFSLAFPVDLCHLLQPLNFIGNTKLIASDILQVLDGFNKEGDEVDSLDYGDDLGPEEGEEEIEEQLMAQLTEE